eukprot:11741661-Alexandrium_andersonii.AAC.1
MEFVFAQLRVPCGMHCGATIPGRVENRCRWPGVGGRLAGRTARRTSACGYAWCAASTRTHRDGWAVC